MKFPKLNLRSESACFRTLSNTVHPEGLHCPRCGQGDGVHVHEDQRQPWRIHYRCSHCGHIFTSWTRTPLQGTHRPPSEILHIMLGILAKQSDSRLARELGRDRGKLAIFRHKLERWIKLLPKEDFTKLATISKKRT